MEFLKPIFLKFSKIKFLKTPSRWNRPDTWGQTDGHDGRNTRSSRLHKRPLKVDLNVILKRSPSRGFMWTCRRTNRRVYRTDYELPQFRLIQIQYPHKCRHDIFRDTVLSNKFCGRLLNLKRPEYFKCPNSPLKQHISFYGTQSNFHYQKSLDGSQDYFLKRKSRVSIASDNKIQPDTS